MSANYLLKLPRRAFYWSFSFTSPTTIALRFNLPRTVAAVIMPMLVALSTSCFTAKEIAHENPTDDHTVLTVHERNGGTNSIRSEPVARDSFKVILIASAQRVCTGECITLTAEASEGLAPYTFKWNPNIGAGAGPHEVCPSQTSRYEVVVTDALATDDNEFPSLPVTASIEIAHDGVCSDAAMIEDAGAVMEAAVETEGSEPEPDSSTIEQQEPITACRSTAVSAGGLHTCAIKTDGTLFCWGSNQYGQLGNNSNVDSFVPVQEHTAATDWANVSAGMGYTCAVKTNGALFCWGSNEFGQLGINSTTNSLVPVQENTAAVDWTNVSAKFCHTCAVKADERLFCWGSNEFGQLGNNATLDSPVPVQEYTAASDWADVSTGQDHTCAVKTNGTIFCWGSNSNGQLSYRFDSDVRIFPVPAQEKSAVIDWASVSTGRRFTCAVKTDGTLFYWGLCDYFVEYCSGSYFNVAQEGTEASDWASVSGGHFHACAVKTDGTLWCWGNNQNGRRGTDSDIIPSQEETLASDWNDVSAGGDHTCAVKTNGTLFCWGSNKFGQLGINDNLDAHCPVQEQTTATDWATLSAEDELTCPIF